MNLSLHTVTKDVAFSLSHYPEGIVPRVFGSIMVGHRTESFMRDEGNAIPPFSRVRTLPRYPNAEIL